MNKKKSIFIVVNSFGRGGAEMSLAILANELAINNYNIFYIALWDEKDKYDFEWLKSNSVNIVTISQNKGSLKIIIKLFKLIRINKPIFIYSAMLKSDFISRILAFFLNTPQAASIRNNPTSYYKIFSLKYYLFFLQSYFQKNIVFLSNKVYDDYKTSFLGKFNRSNLYTLHNPIIFDQTISNNFLKKKFQLLKDKASDFIKNKDVCFRLTIVSRLIEGKGIIEVLNFLGKDLHDKRFSLVIYGDGPLKGSINDFIIDNNLIHKVTLKGFCDNKIEMFENSDILIFGSESEGFGRVPFEALSFGNMVLCNKKISIINEFGNLPILWSDYDTQLVISDHIHQLVKLDIESSLSKLLNIFEKLSPKNSHHNFLKIMNSCIYE